VSDTVFYVGVGESYSSQQIHHSGSLSWSAEVQSNVQSVWTWKCPLWSFQLPVFTTAYGELCTCAGCRYGSISVSLHSFL